jgi:hypothetical protein
VTSALVFDFDIQEQCYETSSCEALMPFVQKGKAVFEAEYSTTLSPTVCNDAKQRGFSVIKKNVALDAPHTVCP